MEMKEYIRFEAPVDQCVFFAENVLKAQLGNVGADATLRSFDGSDVPRSDPRPLDVSWFDVRRVRRGLIGGQQYGPRVWVDLDRGVFYYQR